MEHPVRPELSGRAGGRMSGRRVGAVLLVLGFLGRGIAGALAMPGWVEWPRATMTGIACLAPIAAYCGWRDSREE